jgi:hypothetical protein
MENWRAYQHREDLLSNYSYVTGVLGVKLVLNESYPYSHSLTEEVLQEQLLFEGFIDSIKTKFKDKKDKVALFFKTVAEALRKPEANSHISQLLWSRMFGYKGNTWGKHIIRPVIEKLKELSQKLPEKMQNAFSAAIDKFVGWYEKLGDWYKGIQVSWKKTLLGIALITGLTYLVDKLSELKEATVDKVKDLLQGGFIDFVKSLTDKSFPELFSSVAEKVGDVTAWVDGVKEIIKTAIGPSLQALSGGAAAVGNVLKVMIDATSHVFTRNQDLKTGRGSYNGLSKVQSEGI